MNQKKKMEFGRTRGTKTCERSFSFLHAMLLGVIWLGFAIELRADTISGTVKDPSGAVVVGAQIEIAGGDLAKAIVLTTDGGGKFSSPCSFRSLQILEMAWYV